MRNYIRHTIRLLAVFISCVVMSSCEIEKDREICDYKVQLRYDYNEENTSQGVNRIEYYIYTMDEYIFDGNGVLFQHRQFTADRCTEYLNSEIDLPPGQYSVIAIGNLDERSTVTDAKTGTAPVEKRTRREDMRMTLGAYGHNGLAGNYSHSASPRSGVMSGPSENLYHGYKTFTVKEQGISRVRVDMVHSHLRIRFRVTWKYSTAPERGEYYALLESIPSQYALMPQYIYPAGSLECVEHDCDGHDLYPSNCNNVIHHIPLTCRKDESDAPVNVLTYRHDTKINADWEMWGEFTAYRIKTETQPVLHLLDMSGNSILPGGRSLDLQGYFDWYEYELDHTLKQDYIIDIVVDGTSVTMSPLTVGDWDEGGPL